MTTPTPPIITLNVTGNSSSINGATTTTPNLSTRPSTEIQQVVGILNSNAVVGSDLTASTITADADLTSVASTVTGVNQSVNSVTFNGASAVSAATILGILNSDIQVGGSVFVDPSATTKVLGDLSSKATGEATSNSSVVTGTGSAAVVDLAAVGLQNAFVDIGGSANKLIFSGALSADSSASGVSVGPVTAVGGIPTGLSSGQGVNSVLNLNARGLSPQSQYFETPISPFFATFSGLPTAPTASSITATPLANIIGTSGNSIEIGAHGDIDASAQALGSSTASNVTGDTNAFASAFSAGATLLGNISIGQDGDVSGTSNLGVSLVGPNATPTYDPIITTSTTTTGASSAVTNVLSTGLGTSAVQASAGSAPLAAPAKIDIGNNGDVTGIARSFATTDSNSTTGDVVAFTGGLTGSGGNTFGTSTTQGQSTTITPYNPGNALTVGIFNLDIEAGGLGTSTDKNNVSAIAQSQFITDAQTTTGAAKAQSTTITAGIFGNDTTNTAGPTPFTTDLRIVNGNVTSVASASNTVRANTITGTASATAFNTVVGIGNTNINIAGSGSISASADLISNVGNLTSLTNTASFSGTPA